MTMTRIEATVLTLLTDDWRYGQEVLELAATMNIELSRGTIYPLMVKLECEGLLEMSESEPIPVRGGRRRSYYLTTDKGLDALNAYRTELLEFADWLLKPH